MSVLKLITTSTANDCHPRYMEQVLAAIVTIDPCRHPCDGSCCKRRVIDEYENGKLWLIVK